MADPIELTIEAVAPQDLGADGKPKLGMSMFNRLFGDENPRDVGEARWAHLMRTDDHHNKNLVRTVDKFLNAIGAGSNSLTNDSALLTATGARGQDPKNLQALAYDIDPRRFIQQLSDAKGDVVVNGVTFDTNEVYELKRASASMTDALTRKYVKDMKMAVPQAADESTKDWEERIRPMAESFATDYQVTDNGSFPAPFTPEDTSPEMLEQIAMGTSTSDNTFGVGEDAETGVNEWRFMSERERQRLLNSSDDNVQAFNAILQEDQMGEDWRRTGMSPEGPIEVTGNQTRVEWDGEMREGARTREITSSSNFDQQTLVEDTSYTLTEVLRLPMDMTPQERMEVQRKMVAAGFLPSDMIIDGDPTNPTFRTAWKRLAATSLELKKPMVDLLEERAASYTDALRQQIEVRLTDPARLRINADQIGRNMLGRKLTDDEHARMTEFVHDLERRNAMEMQGIDPDAPEDGEPELGEDVIADIDARMNQYVRESAPVEAGAHDVADQYSAFSEMLAGPSRGMS